MFTFDYDDPEWDTNDRILSSDAARAIVADMPDSDWPHVPATIPPALLLEVQKLMREAYFQGALYTAASMRAETTLNGISLIFPPLVGTAVTNPARMISYETMLPLLNGRPTKGHLENLGHRLRGLAELCFGRAAQMR